MFVRQIVIAMKVKCKNALVIPAIFQCKRVPIYIYKNGRIVNDS